LKKNPGKRIEDMTEKQLNAALYSDETLGIDSMG
jgi:hypothetical protein